jgi:hypothetical protein
LIKKDLEIQAELLQECLVPHCHLLAVVQELMPIERRQQVVVEVVVTMLIAMLLTAKLEAMDEL